MSEARAIAPVWPQARGLRLTAAVAGLAAWIGLWWAAATLLGVSADFLPSPLDVARRLQWLATNSVGEGTLWVHAGWSLLRFFSGFAAAAAFAVPLGLAMGYVPALRHLVNPLFDLFRHVPPIAWAPFALLWFGASFGSQTFVIFTAAFPPILMNAHHGIATMDRGLVNAARMLGAGPFTVLFRIGLRATLPAIVAGLRIGLANGWLALVGAEIIAGPGALSGLGFLILVGQQNLQATTAVAAMSVIGLIGAVLDALLVILARKL